MTNEERIVQMEEQFRDLAQNKGEDLAWALARAMFVANMVIDGPDELQQAVKERFRFLHENMKVSLIAKPNGNN
jgi:hypothetical protein